MSYKNNWSREYNYCDNCGESNPNPLLTRYSGGSKYCFHCNNKMRYEREQAQEKAQKEAEKRAERERIRTQHEEWARNVKARERERERQQSSSGLTKDERITELERQVNNLQKENQVLKAQISQQRKKEWKELGERIKKGQEASQLLLQVIEAKIEVYKK